MPRSRVQTPDPAGLLAVIQVMSKRLPFQFGASYLRAQGFAVGRNWPETLQKFEAMDKSQPLAVNAVPRLKEVLSTLSLVYNKRVTWFDFGGLPAEDAARFSDWVRAAPTMNLPDSDWIANYPFPLAPTSTAILRSFNRPPVLVSVFSEGRKYYFQYFSVRAYNEKVQFQVNAIKSDVYDDIGDYEQIYGVKHQYVPCFDTVAVDLNSKRIELRIDIPEGVVPSEVQALAAQHVLTEFNSVSAGRCSVSPLGFARFDFLPLLKPLYQDRTAGRVTMLGFAAIGENTSSNNTGKPYRSRARDLRLDEFHQHGAAGVSDVRPYTIGVEWPGQGRPGYVGLEVPGKISYLYKNHPLVVANMTGCVSTSEYEFLVDRVEYFAQVAIERALAAANAAQAAMQQAGQALTA